MSTTNPTYASLTEEHAKRPSSTPLVKKTATETGVGQEGTSAIQGHIKSNTASPLVQKDTTETGVGQDAHTIVEAHASGNIPAEHTAGKSTSGVYRRASGEAGVGTPGHAKGPKV